MKKRFSVTPAYLNFKKQTAFGGKNLIKCEGLSTKTPGSRRLQPASEY